MLEFDRVHIVEIPDKTDSIVEKDFGISRGVTGFDRKFSLPVCKTEANIFLKMFKL